MARIVSVSRVLALVALALVALFALMSSSVVAVASEPILPSFFHGTAVVNGRDVPVNSEVIAKVDGQVRGTIKVTTIGYYGSASTDQKLSVFGDRDTQGEEVSFFVKLPGKQEIPASQVGTWIPGGKAKLDLVFSGPEVDAPVTVLSNVTTNITTNSTIPNSLRSQVAVGNREEFVYNAITGGYQLSLYLTNDNIPVTELQILLKDDVPAGSVFVFEKTFTPGTTLLPNAFSYMSITASNIVESNVRMAVIRFKVPNDWIEFNNVDPSKIAMQRLVGTQWVTLRTVNEGADADYTYYRAQTPGFSMFAIVAQGVAQAAGVPAATPTPAATSAPQQDSFAGADQQRPARDVRDLRQTESGSASEQVADAPVDVPKKKASPMVGIMIIVIFALVGIIAHLALSKRTRRGGRR